MTDIITLQFGQYANYVGSHFWNAQNITAGVTTPHHITSVTRHEDKFCPRLIIADQTGSFGHLNKCALTKEPKASTCWNSELKEIRTENKRKNLFLQFIDSLSADMDVEEEGEEKEEKIKEEKEKTVEDEEKENEKKKNNNSEEEKIKKQTETDSELLKALFTNPDLRNARGYNLDEDVTVWSDFLNVELNDQTIFEIPSIFNVDLFTSFDHGLQAAHNHELIESYEDRIRKYAEECDFCPSFCVLCDCTSAWSGFAHNCIMNMRDEYANASVLTFSVEEPLCGVDSDEIRKKRELHTLNHSLSVSSIGQMTSLYIPLCVPNVGLYPNNVNVSLPYHSSAMLGSAVDNISLAWRVKGDNNLTFPIFQSQFSIRKNNFASVGFSLPCECNVLTQNLRVKSTLKKDEFETIPLYSVRNVMQSLTANVNLPLRSQPVAEFAVLRSSDAKASNYFKESVNVLRTRSKRVFCEKPFEIPETFPQFFNSKEESPIKNCDVLSYVQSSTELHPFLFKLAEAHRTLWKNNQKWFDSDEHSPEDVEETLYEMADAYSE